MLQAKKEVRLWVLNPRLHGDQPGAPLRPQVAALLEELHVAFAAEPVAELESLTDGAGEAGPSGLAQLAADAAADAAAVSEAQQVGRGEWL